MDDSAPSSRDSYAFLAPITLRWKDNDVYGHVNNVEYYSFFDSAINTWLIREGGLDIEGGEVIGLCAESHCRFARALAFPQTIDCAVRVSRLGRSSVTYELALFEPDAEEPAATGWFVHVFVERATRRSCAIPAPLASALARLQTAEGS